MKLSYNLCLLVIGSMFNDQGEYESIEMMQRYTRDGNVDILFFWQYSEH